LIVAVICLGREAGGVEYINAASSNCLFDECVLQGMLMLAWLICGLFEKYQYQYQYLHLQLS
jgi:hypothetical protein